MVDITSSHGAKLLIETAVPDTYEEIGGVGDIDGPNVQHRVTERATHSEASVVRVVGITDPGQISAPIDWDGTDAGQVLLAAAFGSKSKVKFQIQYQDANQSQDSFSAFVSQLGKSAPVEGTNVRQMVLSLASAVTEGTWT